MFTLPVPRAREGENLLRVEKDHTVFELGNLFVKAVSGIEPKLRHLVSEMRRIPNSFVRLATTEDNEEESNRIFHILNLFLFVSLALLSPERAFQVLSPEQPGYVLIRGFHEAVEMLRKLAPL